MAKKIIPLKLKKLKGSPLSFTRNDATDAYSKFLDRQTLGLFDFSSMGKTRLEDQFQQGVDKLAGTDVTKNFYADLVNPYAGLTDRMASLENTAEDLTINQRQFDLQERALQRGLSQTLQQSKATGIQSAQAIANQLSESSAQAAAGIGEQERQNQAARVQQASQLQQAKAQSAQQLDMQKAQGQFQVDMQMRQGAEQALGRDLNKQQAILGLLSGQIAREDQQEQQNRGWLTKVLNIF